jgi:glycerate kinase
LKFLVAPNPFKGTLSSLQAARAIARGLGAIERQASCEIMPLADGGPGTLAALRAALGGKLMRARVRGPLGDPVTARWLRLQGRRGVIESAEAIGLAQLRGKKPRPLQASSYGLGQLMLAARQAGCRELWIGLGGSATTDAGLGMALALGSPAAIKGLRLRVLCDVDNPLYGPRGAAHVFAPQKGANPAQLLALDARLRAAGRLMPEGLALRPGAGAAGGLGAGLMAWAGADLVPGAETLLELCRFKERVRNVDWVVSGEGRLDSQSLRGKLPVALARAALKAGKRCLLVCGSIEKGLRLKGVDLVELKNLRFWKP